MSTLRKLPQALGVERSCLRNSTNCKYLRIRTSRSRYSIHSVRHGILHHPRQDCPAGVKAGLAAGAEIIAVTTDLTRQKFRDTNLLDRSHTLDDARTLPAVVHHLGAHGQPLGG